jgi:phosphate uptake regulator
MKYQTVFNFIVAIAIGLIVAVVLDNDNIAHDRIKKLERQVEKLYEHDLEQLELILKTNQKINRGM